MNKIATIVSAGLAVLMAAATSMSTTAVVKKGDTGLSQPCPHPFESQEQPWCPES